MTTDLSTVGSWMKSVRGSRLSLAQLGQKLGCSRSFLHDIEIGRRNPDLELFVLFCREFEYEPWTAIRHFGLLEPDAIEYLLDAAVASRG